MIKFLSSLSIAAMLSFSLLSTSSNAKTELTNGNVSISHDCPGDSKHPCPKPTPKAKEDVAKHPCPDGSDGKHPCPKPTATPKPTPTPKPE